MRSSLCNRIREARFPLLTTAYMKLNLQLVVLGSLQILEATSTKVCWADNADVEDYAFAVLFETCNIQRRLRT